MTPSNLTVRDVMEALPAVVSPDCPLRDVLALMNERRIGSVLVVRNGQQLCGIFTERDLLRRVAFAPPGWRDGPVAEWMTRDPHTVGPDVGWEEAVRMMETRRVRHLPVVDREYVVGVITSRMLMGRRTEYLNRRIEAAVAELRQANEQLLARDADMLYNLRAAGRLQTRVLLPHAPPARPDLHWAIHFAPLDHLGGDYYDFSTLDADRVGFLIADASGHSIPAALVAVMTHFAFEQAAAGATPPGDVLTAMNRQLQDLTEERFVTAWYGVFDCQAGRLRFATAGHPPPLVFRSADRGVSPLGGRGFMIGIVPGEVYTEREIELGPGDKIVFYTDGLVESRNEIGELFGTDRLARCLSEHGREGPDEIMRAVLARRAEFGGTAPLTDDLTVAVAEIGPA
jgi:serine phosphatase RsbU (regulator of sigma subunit)/CBS domain-containing protein